MVWYCWFCMTLLFSQTDAVILLPSSLRCSIFAVGGKRWAFSTCCARWVSNHRSWKKRNCMDVFRKRIDYWILPFHIWGTLKNTMTRRRRWSTLHFASCFRHAAWTRMSSSGPTWSRGIDQNSQSARHFGSVFQAVRPFIQAVPFCSDTWDWFDLVEKRVSFCEVFLDVFRRRKGAATERVSLTPWLQWAYSHTQPKWQWTLRHFFVRIDRRSGHFCIDRH